MNLFSAFIVIVLLVWLVISIRYIYKNKNSGCNMNCSHCKKNCNSNRDKLN